MPLQNRVDPFGTIHAVPERGTMMGNRGGRIHDPATQKLTRHHASRRWIACVCEFTGRRRQVMGRSYTELFFLDEVTAFAAGHRPCAECRRADFNRFMEHWRAAFAITGPLRVGAVDAVLHRERMIAPEERYQIDAAAVADSPDGGIVYGKKMAFALRGGKALPWSFSGYGDAIALAKLPEGLRLLTPPAIVKVFLNGYGPRWHSSAGA